MHPIRARGGKQSSGAQSSPSYHPPSELKLGGAPVLAASHASWTTGTPPTISLSSPSAIAPIFLPPILGCCKGFAAVCQRHAGLKQLRGPRGRMRAHAMAQAHTTYSGLPLLSLNHGAGRDCGGRVPSGRECAPALPGEVCKHSCSRTGEPLGARQPGLHRAGAGGRDRQGAEVPRLKPGRQPETTPLLQPPPQTGRAPLQHTKIPP